VKFYGEQFLNDFSGESDVLQNRFPEIVLNVFVSITLFATFAQFSQPCIYKYLVPDLDYATQVFDENSLAI
jgi:hypothetical protein